MREQPDLGQRDGEAPEAWLARLQGVDAAALTMHQRIARSHGKDRAERLIKERRAPPPAAGGTESPPAVPPPPGPGVAAPPALGLAKDAYLRLSAGDRRQFDLWLAGQ